MHRLTNKLRELLLGGTSHHELALTIALGAALGTIPILGVTTLLCGAAALALRLNLPLIQTVNYLVYPLQLAAYIPFLMAGARVLDPGRQELTLGAVYSMIQKDLGGTVQELFWANLGAVLLWAALALPLGGALYFGLRRIMRNLHRNPQPAS
jgi:uncharacterized protein (DUF2062 family)